MKNKQAMQRKIKAALEGAEIAEKFALDQEVSDEVADAIEAARVKLEDALAAFEEEMGR